MKTYLTLTLNERGIGKKSMTKQMLKNNVIPGVIYLKGGKNLNVSIDFKQLNAIVNDPSGLTRIYEVKIGEKTMTCMLKEVQFNPVFDSPRHFDLMEVKDGDVVKVDVPVRIMNKDVCPGVKNGGDVYVLSYNVKLKCKVECVPYAIEVDVKRSNMGEKFFLKDITIPDGCSIIKNVILARIAGKRVIKEAASETAATEDTAAATTTDTTTATPAPAAAAK
ncbi:MAG: 50S ribosomal protein L25 [Rickettsiales bacterium]|nr:50S ribosomal protein L25 [Rickettsiales bacterium]